MRGSEEDFVAHGVPSPVDSFLGRNEDLRNVVGLLKRTRLLTVTGEPGLGKSSLVKAVANFFKDRRGLHFEHGVLYISAINCVSHYTLQQRFVQCFAERPKGALKKLDTKDSTQLFQTAIAQIARKSFLLILDDAEDLLRIEKKKTEKDPLMVFFEQVLHGSPKTNILSTSKFELTAFIGSIKDISERVYRLGPLNPV